MLHILRDILNSKIFHDSPRGLQSFEIQLLTAAVLFDHYSSHKALSFILQRTDNARPLHVIDTQCLRLNEEEFSMFKIGKKSKRLLDIIFLRILLPCMPLSPVWHHLLATYLLSLSRYVYHLFY